MELLTIHDKEQLISEIQALELALGPAPLKNVEPTALSARDIDVVAVGSMVFRTDNSTVLVRRGETPREWVIPGGTVDEGEDLVGTAIRETREETGLETKIDALLRIGLARDYGPQPFRKVNLARFGSERINLLFVNFRSHEIGGQLDWSSDPGHNILEARAFTDIPFHEITHVYKVLFVQQQLYRGQLANFPAVEFEPVRGSGR
jgi:8-oxo-dGTP pyrophosphatase MutT (NUDIX family)